MIKTKEKFHKLIDDIEDEDALRSYFTLVQKLNNRQSGELWEHLNAEEKKDLLQSYDESFDLNNLISHDQVQKQHAKWLRK